MRILAGMRITAGLTQAEVAKKLDVSQCAVSTWESGKYNPSLDKIIQLAKLYGVTEQEILIACTSAPTTIVSQSEVNKNG